MDEGKQAKANVRERERAIWHGVEAAGREARAADAQRPSAKDTEKPTATQLTENPA